MVLAVVCCGDRLNETRTMLKSAAVLSHSPLTMIVFTEDILKSAFTEMVSVMVLVIVISNCIDISISTSSGYFKLTARSWSEEVDSVVTFPCSLHHPPNYISFLGQCFLSTLSLTTNISCFLY